MPDTVPTSPTRRVIGRILSVGFPLPGSRVDNYTFFSAPSFFDYDAMVIDPAAVAHSIESVIAGDDDATTFTGASVRNLASVTGEVALADLLRRRRDETARLLENGGVIVCFAHPPPKHTSVIGVEDGADLAWLPVPGAPGTDSPRLVAGEGSQAQIVDFQHPLAGFVLGQSANIAYRAHFDAKAAEGVHVFVRSAGGAAIGFEVALPSGRLIYVPALRAVPSGDARYSMSDALQAGVRRALGVMAEGRAPTWVGKRALPGLDARAQSLAAARARLTTAEEEARAAETALDELARYQRLLWQEGSAGLDEVVIEALRLLGFDVYASDPAELQIRHGGKMAVVEIEGSERPIDLTPHYRLRQRIERAIERRAGDPPRGIIFINGQRLEAPERRTQASDALLTASATMRYCLAPTSGLFDAVVAALADDVDTVAAYRSALLSTDGCLT